VAVPILSYLRFALADEADRAAFEQDLDEMLRLATSQPGFQWSEVTRSLTDGVVYVVVSEWDEVEQVRAWEHHPDHEEVIERWAQRYRESFVHRRFVPWIRPQNG
jgi:heme-degrading monooxygenase HmoA